MLAGLEALGVPNATQASDLLTGAPAAVAKVPAALVDAQTFLTDTIADVRGGWASRARRAAGGSEVAHCAGRDQGPLALTRLPACPETLPSPAPGHLRHQVQI